MRQLLIYQTPEPLKYLSALPLEPIIIDWNMRCFLRKYQNSALGERFQQILEEQISSLLASQIRADPTLSAINEENTNPENQQKERQNDSKKVDSHPSESAFAAARIDNYLQDQKFANVYQKEIAYVASEPLLRSQSSRAMADTISRKPWDGTELTSEASLRMLTDALPGPKPHPNQKQKLIISPPVPWQERVKSARELSIDYKVSKDDKEKDDFREMYRERLLGPSMLVDASLPRATLGLIGTLADARINAAIDQKTGKFETPDMDSVRGKPLDSARLANSTDTTFFINDILNRQDCLPPWIESQQGTQRGILAFRRDLQKKWFKVLIGKLGKDKSIALEKSHSASFRDMSGHINDYKCLHSPYIEEKIALLNREIRSYNLQCPSPSLHKWKLVPETEIRKLFDQVIEGIDELVGEWFEAQNTSRDNPKMVGIFDLSPVTLFGPDLGKLEIWKLVKLIFGR